MLDSLTKERIGAFSSAMDLLSLPVSAAEKVTKNSLPAVHACLARMRRWRLGMKWDGGAHNSLL